MQHWLVDDRLPSLLAAVANEPDAQKALHLLLQGCADLVGADGGRIYRLSLANGAYEVHTSINTEVGPPIDARCLVDTSAHLSPTEGAIKRRKTVNFCKEAGPCWLIVPILRGKEALGTIEFVRQGDQMFDDRAIALAGTVAPVALFLFERSHTLRLLKAEQQPINFQQGFRDFLNTVILLVADASSMPFIVLSELVDDTLVCRAHYGLRLGDDPKDLSLLDLPGDSDSRVLEMLSEQGDPIVVPDVRMRPDDAYLPWLNYCDFSSYVLTRVTANDRSFGTLWFGYHCPYELSVLEVETLDSIATGIGVHVSNYTNLQSHQADIVKSIEISTAITTVEVAQAARHEARSHLDLAHNRLSIISAVANDPTRANLSKLPVQVQHMETALAAISMSLEKIKSVTKPPARTRTDSSLQEIWRAAFHVVEARLALEHIDYQVTGKDVRASVFVDFLMHAFLNLVLNSLDAFRESGKRRNRNITVHIEDPADAANAIRMRYSDNATGIEVNNLAGGRLEQEGPTLEAIFEPGVTSKKGGSGFGLYLVRKILQEHGGSIDLKSFKGGVTFEITLPKEVQ